MASGVFGADQRTKHTAERARVSSRLDRRGRAAPPRACVAASLKSRKHSSDNTQHAHVTSTLDASALGDDGSLDSRCSNVGAWGQSFFDNEHAFVLDIKKISPIIYIWYEGGWLSPPVVTAAWPVGG
jgi:hypothetical protein